MTMSAERLAVQLSRHIQYIADYKTYKCIIEDDNDSNRKLIYLPREMGNDRYQMRERSDFPISMVMGKGYAHVVSMRADAIEEIAANISASGEATPNQCMEIVSLSKLLENMFEVGAGDKFCLAHHVAKDNYMHVNIRDTSIPKLYINDYTEAIYDCFIEYVKAANEVYAEYVKSMMKVVAEEFIKNSIERAHA